MFRATTIAGLSMSSRRNRRLLVVLTYFGIAAMTVVLGVSGATHLQSPLWLILVFVIVFSGVSRGLFGAVVPQQTLRDRTPKPSGGRFNLRPTREWVDVPEDERDVAVRNAAYFYAFRFVTLFALLVWFVVLVFQDPKVHIPSVVLQLLITYLVVLMLTLPQAIMLWNHPDLID